MKLTTRAANRAELASAIGKRNRAGEAAEQERTALQEAGRCITPGCGRPSKTQRCPECRGKVEANTERYRGAAVKGPPTKAHTDLTDLRYALGEHVAAGAAITEVLQRPLSARDRALELEPHLARLALSVRFTRAVLERHGYQEPQPGPDEDPEIDDHDADPCESDTEDRRLPRGYRDRKLLDVCARPGCDDPPAEDSDYCVPHRDDQRARMRRSAAKRRQRDKRSGRALCGHPGKGARCARCLVRDGKTPRLQGVNNSVNNSPRSWRDPTGRMRYHGKLRQGRQKNVDLDVQDLDDAIERLKRAKAGLVYAASPAVQAEGRVVRDDAKHAALAHAGHAIRFARDVLERHRYPVDPVEAVSKPRGESGR